MTGGKNRWFWKDLRQSLALPSQQLHRTLAEKASPPLLSLPRSRKPAAAGLAGCHKARIGPAKLPHVLHPTSKLLLPHCRSPAECKPLTRAKQLGSHLTGATKPPLCLLVPTGNRTGRAPGFGSLALWLFTIDHDHFASGRCFWTCYFWPHQKSVSKSKHHRTLQCWIQAQTPAFQYRPLLKALALISEGLGDEGSISDASTLRNQTNFHK